MDNNDDNVDDEVVKDLGESEAVPLLPNEDDGEEDSKEDSKEDTEAKSQRRDYVIHVPEETARTGEVIILSALFALIFLACIVVGVYFYLDRRRQKQIKSCMQKLDGFRNGSAAERKLSRSAERTHLLGSEEQRNRKQEDFTSDCTEEESLLSESQHVENKNVNQNPIDNFGTASRSANWRCCRCVCCPDRGKETPPLDQLWPMKQSHLRNGRTSDEKVAKKDSLKMSQLRSSKMQIRYNVPKVKKCFSSPEHKSKPNENRLRRHFSEGHLRQPVKRRKSDTPVTRQSFSCPSSSDQQNPTKKSQPDSQRHDSSKPESPGDIQVRRSHVFDDDWDVENHRRIAYHRFNRSKNQLTNHEKTDKIDVDKAEMNPNRATEHLSKGHDRTEEQTSGWRGKRDTVISESRTHLRHNYSSYASLPGIDVDERSFTVNSESKHNIGAARHQNSGLSSSHDRQCRQVVAKNNGPSCNFNNETTGKEMKSLHDLRCKEERCCCNKKKDGTRYQHKIAQHGALENIIADHEVNGHCKCHLSTITSLPLSNQKLANMSSHISEAARIESVPKRQQDVAPLMSRHLHQCGFHNCSETRRPFQSRRHLCLESCPQRGRYSSDDPTGRCYAGECASQYPKNNNPLCCYGEHPEPRTCCQRHLNQSQNNNSGDIDSDECSEIHDFTTSFEEQGKFSTLLQDTPNITGDECSSDNEKTVEDAHKSRLELKKIMKPKKRKRWRSIFTARHNMMSLFSHVNSAAMECLTSSDEHDDVLSITKKLLRIKLTSRKRKNRRTWKRLYLPQGISLENSSPISSDNLNDEWESSSKMSSSPIVHVEDQRDSMTS